MPKNRSLNSCTWYCSGVPYYNIVCLCDTGAQNPILSLNALYYALMPLATFLSLVAQPKSKPAPVRFVSLPLWAVGLDEARNRTLNPKTMKPETQKAPKP